MDQASQSPSRRGMRKPPQNTVSSGRHSARGAFAAAAETAASRRPVVSLA